jgi:hypothetical protein
MSRIGVERSLNRWTAKVKDLLFGFLFILLAFTRAAGVVSAHKNSAQMIKGHDLVSLPSTSTGAAQKMRQCVN